MIYAILLFALGAWSALYGFAAYMADSPGDNASGGKYFIGGLALIVVALVIAGIRAYFWAQQGAVKRS